MRILHWTEGFWPLIGGVETLLMNLTRWQRNSGNVVSVLTDRAHDALPLHDCIHGVEIRRVAFSPAILRHDLAAIGNVARDCAALLESFRPDVIHLHVAHGHFPWLYALTKRTVPSSTVVTIHMPLASVFLSKSILARILRDSDRIAFVSDATRREWFGVSKGFVEKSCVVANGVPWPDEEPTPLEFGSPTLLCLGRLDSAKGFDVALQAFAKVVDRHPKARLVIAGEGPERSKLEQLATCLNVATRVNMRGWVSPDQIPTVVNGATIVLMPSRWSEPFGLVAVEAGQMGRPVVASRTGGLPDIVMHEKTGILVEAEDPAALGTAIESLIANPEVCRRLGAAAREHTRTTFAIERCAEAYRSIYSRSAAISPKSAHAATGHILD